MDKKEQVLEWFATMDEKEQVLEWFNNFVNYVGNVDSNLYNKACEYADEKENDGE